jgi:hypothetical protein
MRAEVHIYNSLSKLSRCCQSNHTHNKRRRFKSSSGYFKIVIYFDESSKN